MLRSSPLFALLLSVVLVSGCGRKEAKSGSASSSGAGGAAGTKVLNLGNGTEPQDLDPHIVTGVPEHHVITALFEGLVGEGPSGSDSVGGAAERWDISPDALAYTFYLRANGRWSNGDPVTAQDFIRSFQRILTPTLASEYAYKLHDVVGAEEFNKGTLTDFSKVGFTAKDDRTLEIRLKRRAPYLIEALKHYAWFPVHLPTLAKHGDPLRKGSAWTRPENIVGNGPFILREWRANQRIVVTRSPTYWDKDAVKLDQINFFPTESIDTEERMFRTGQLHKTNELPIAKIETYRRDFADSYRQDPYYGVYFYRLNVTKPPLNDKRVRRALALAIDRDALVKNVTRGGQTPALNFVPPSAQYTSQAQLKGDLDEARRLLAEAGFPEGRGFPRIEILYNTSENHRIIAEAIQQMWRRNLGVDIGILNQEWKVYLDSQDVLRYDICRAGWIGDYTDPNTFMDMWVKDGGNNDTGWSNPEYERLLAESQSAPDDAARLATYQKMETLLMDELPFIPIYFYTRVYAINPKVRWVKNVLDNRNWKFVDIAN
jgi:oligopeptide transport system substrate-binding protein